MELINNVDNKNEIVGLCDGCGCGISESDIEKNKITKSNDEPDLCDECYFIIKSYLRHWKLNTTINTFKNVGLSVPEDFFKKYKLPMEADENE